MSRRSLLKRESLRTNPERKSSKPRKRSEEAQRQLNSRRKATALELGGGDVPWGDNVTHFGKFKTRGTWA